MAEIDLICVDPGKHQTGLALFGSGELHSAKLIETGDRSLSESAVNQIRDSRRYGSSCGWGPTIIIEIPRIYRQSSVRPNDIVELAFMAGCIAGGLSGMNSINKLILYTPRDWGGQVDKKIKNKRTLARHPELAEMLKIYPGSFHEHVLDAVAMGDYYLTEQKL